VQAPQGAKLSGARERVGTEGDRFGSVGSGHPFPSPKVTVVSRPPASTRTASPAAFIDRHIGPNQAAVDQMLAAIGVASLDDLVAKAVPAAIRATHRLDLPPAGSEPEVAALLQERAAANLVRTSLIGLGYYATHTPAVIRRGVLENPSWYTAYTPYQPEISQGRLEALLGFQTVISDLTGLPVAGASLLDEATAAAEAMTLCRRASSSKSDRFLVDADTHPQTLAVLATRAEPLGIELQLFDVDVAVDTPDAFGALLGYPGSSGQVRDLAALTAALHDAGALVAATTDLLALTVLTPPAEWGADIAVGSAQRFGVPVGFGGPHAGFMSVRDSLARQLPGRLVGVSVDAAGQPAYRLALQTREQHIRREKATSNICTAQVLLAVVASFYAEYHGPEGLTAIAELTHARATLLAAGLAAMGITTTSTAFFDTVRVAVPDRAAAVVAAAEARGINVWAVDSSTLSIALDETTTDQIVMDVLNSFADVLGVAVPALDSMTGEATSNIPENLRRTSDFLTHPNFHQFRSETAMLRRLRRLADKDIALDRAMIPLGSCTMKLNATTEMEPVTDPAWANIHPFAPMAQAAGYAQLIRELEAYLVEITGYDAVSLQPNAGSQGEFAGLLAIRAYHHSRGEAQRDICLIPSSAHGTNAASAVMAGLRVVVVACTEEGEVDLVDLQAKIDQHSDRLAALMITYPSTFGVYERGVVAVCAAVHDAGGQVYVDGANLNALVGLAQPGRFGADVSHLNLHKTFCIPHGGGGPGVGPVAVRSHLAPFLPGHPLRPEAGPLGRGHEDGGVGPVSAAPWGSAGILTIPWAYIRLMGADGLTRATEVAVLSANYIATRLRDHYPVLYSGADGLVAHECIIDLRTITKQTGVTVDDVAKRLVDYGFHAPTMSFPVAGTLMIEPTESEDLPELDRFCDALIAIRAEIEQVATGVWDVVESPLRGAPHTAASLLGEWSAPYSREFAAYPMKGQADSKYWPPVRRLDGAYGDRNLVCSCPDPTAFEDPSAA
jgi:glycine dehydrogenase